jgi:hypothetical protein
VFPSRPRIGARPRLLRRAGLLAAPVALALAGVAFAVVAGPPNDVTTNRAWIEAASDPPSPDARDDYRTLAEDSGAITVPVLHNDWDQDGLSTKQLEVTAVSDPTHGTATVIQGAGSTDQISYTPDEDYCNDPSGRDDVRYEVTNGPGYTDVARVRPRVTCVDDPAPPAKTGDASPKADAAVLDRVKPVLSSGSLSSSFFKAAGSGPSTSRAEVGTTVYVTLSEPSRVRYTVQRRYRGRGRKAGGKCQKRNRSNNRAPRCNLWGPVRGSFNITAPAGTSHFRFRGRIGGRTLRPGHYRFNSRATDRAGNRSKVKRRRFKIVR